MNTQQQPYRLEAGDAFEAKVYYHTASGDGTKSGLSSQDEMAILTLRFYPTLANRNFPFSCFYGLPLPACKMSHNVMQLSSATELGRTFGVSSADVVAKSSVGSPSCLAPSTKDVHFNPGSGGASLEIKSILMATATMSAALALLGV